MNIILATNDCETVIYETVFVESQHFMSITIKEIARDLGLAVSTVSKALRNSYEISQETKQRVFEYAEKLDYLPNPYASSLKRRKTGNIAVVIPEVADSFFSIAINGIESIAQEKGYHVIVYLTHEDQKKEQAILRDFRSGRVDGVLMSVASGMEDRRYIKEFCLRETPIVFFDRICEDTQAAKVTTNDADAAFLATRHLFERGCKNVAFLSMFGNLAILNNRLEGYKRAHSEFKIKVKLKNIVTCTDVDEQNLTIIRKLLKSKERPDGVVGSVEKVTTLLYTVSKELKIKIPRDLKVVGFSNLQIAALLDPPLTTVAQPAFEMGKAAASILFGVLDKKKVDLAKETMVLPSLLVKRSST
ncbi:MAG: LacI family DNA-binding transcriptional regulator [Bacteroidota bacterium]